MAQQLRVFSTVPRSYNGSDSLFGLSWVFMYVCIFMYTQNTHTHTSHCGTLRIQDGTLLYHRQLSHPGYLRVPISPCKTGGH